MNKDEILGQILSILHTVKEDKQQLQKILDFLMHKIYQDPEGEFDIPDKYRKLIHDIADNINAGFICFVNPDTLEMEMVSKDLISDPEEYELTTGDKWEDSFKHDDWKKCITIEPPESGESFRIMEQFANEVDNQNLQNQLFYALSHAKPFANFKNIVENSSLREQWFEFKKLKLEAYVWEQLQNELPG